MTRRRRTPAPLRVLVAGLNYAPETTGIAPYTTGLARHLAQEHDVTVVTGHPHYPEWRLHPGYRTPRPPEQDRGVRVVRVRHPVPRDPGGAARVLMEAVYSTRVARHLLRERPDVVVAVSPALLVLVPAVLLRLVAGYRLGAVVQDLYGAALSETGLGGGRLARLTARLEAALLRRADGVVVIHEVFARRLRDAGVPGDRITVVPNWVHVSMPPHDEPADDDRVATRRSLGWADDEVIALHAGNMGAKQGLEGLIDVARAAETRRSRVRIVLLGEGSRRAVLQEHARGISRVSFLDPLPDGEFESALRAADCLLLHEKPGVVEMSVPSKLTTYFASGRPVVAATDPRSGAAALMRASGAGPVVRAGEPEEVLAAIERIAGDPDLAGACGAAGRRFAAERLGAAASLEGYGSWLVELAHDRPPRRVVRPARGPAPPPGTAADGTTGTSPPPPPAEG
ncbi:glycosyltransferase family 4 protein [Geodermatophilus sp. SYSU D00684]